MARAASADCDTYFQPDEDSLRLDYGEGTVIVEMVDWDRFGDAYGLLDDDRVTVSGRLDGGFLENMHFFAYSAYKEGDAAALWSFPVTTVVTSTANLRGTVSSVDEDHETFTLNTGDLVLTVDTANLMYDPLDDYGYQKINEGDPISVTGFLTTDLFTGHELK